MEFSWPSVCVAASFRPNTVHERLAAYPVLSGLNAQIVAIILSIIGTVCSAVEKYFGFSQRASVCRGASVQLLTLCNDFVRTIHFIWGN